MDCHDGKLVVGCWVEESRRWWSERRKSSLGETGWCEEGMDGLGGVWMEQHNHLHGLLRSSTINIGDRLLNSSCHVDKSCMVG